jgi:GT2 family glycosyltransferase
MGGCKVDNPNVAVVVCTFNRPHELRACLGSISAQRYRPMLVVVVDSSQGSARAENSQFVEQLDRPGVGLRFRHVGAPGGLTRQRNLGVTIADEEAHTDWILFVDDDVQLSEDYLHRLSEHFGSGVVGIEGRDVNTGTGRRLDRWLYPRLAPNSYLSKTGHNWFPDGDKVLRTDWLSGCAPAYSMDLLRRLRFDETRGGNGHGEDVDFSFRAAWLGALFWDPNATYQHRKSSQNRASGADAAREVISHRLRLATDFAGVFPVTWVRVGLVIDGVRALLKGALFRRPELLSFGAQLANPVCGFW